MADRNNGGMKACKRINSPDNTPLFQPFLIELILRNSAFGEISEDSR
jgi:hypothetical protein